MKHHGNYRLRTPDELLLDYEADSSDGYVLTQLERHRRKYKNDKRHKEKHFKTRNGYKRTQ